MDRQKRKIINLFSLLLLTLILMLPLSGCKPSINIDMLEGNQLMAENDGFSLAVDVDGDGRRNFLFRTPAKGIQFDLLEQNETIHTYLEEREWNLGVKQDGQAIGQFRFVLKKINQKDYFYLLRYTPTVNTGTPFPVELVVYGEESIMGRIPISEIGEDKNPTHFEYVHLQEGEEKLQVHSIYLDGAHISFKIGAVEVYSDLGHYARELITEAGYPLGKQKAGEEFIFTHLFPQQIGTYAETWGILGKKGLFEWENPAFTQTILSKDVTINKKLSLEGVYHRIPLTYDPYSSNGYFLNPANIVGLYLIQEANQSDDLGRYIADLALIMGYAALPFQNEAGFWATHPKSEWLAREYGIGHNYFDNRRNADNTTFLLELYKRYPDEHFMAALNRHIQFIYTYLEERSIHTSEIGILVTDYVGFPTGEQTHSALNHHLALMNFLLKWVMQTDDEQGKVFVERMIRGVEDTRDLWVKEDHNLYYGLYPNLKPHPYPDYPTLTLRDLLISQGLLEEWVGEENESFQYLISKKSDWALKNGHIKSPIE